MTKVKEFCVHVTQEVSTLLQISAQKLGYNWAVRSEIYHPYQDGKTMKEYYILFNPETKHVRHSYNARPASDIIEITSEQAIEYFLNGNVTWNKACKMTIGNSEVIINSDGTVKFGCTTATKEQVDKIIASREALMK